MVLSCKVKLLPYVSQKGCQANIEANIYISILSLFYLIGHPTHIHSSACLLPRELPSPCGGRGMLAIDGGGFRGKWGGFYFGHIHCRGTDLAPDPRVSESLLYDLADPA